MVHFLIFFFKVILPVLLLILTLDFWPSVTILTEKRTLEEPFERLVTLIFFLDAFTLKVVLPLPMVKRAVLLPA